MLKISLGNLLFISLNFDFQDLFKTQNSLIGDFRVGHGLMCAIELVSDRATKQPVSKDVPMKVLDVAYEHGVMVRASGPNLILSPPLIVTSDDIQLIIDALDAGLSAMSSAGE